MNASIDKQTGEARNWCPPSEIDPREASKPGVRMNPEQAILAQIQKNPALTIPQTQALLDAADLAYDGQFLGFYAHGLFGGLRVKETKEMGAEGFAPEEGVQNLPTQASKKNMARSSELQTNITIIIEGLKAAGRYGDENLAPNHNQRAAIHVLAGFTSNSKQAHMRARHERKRLAKLGIELPTFNWGIPFPKNALRRTSLSMHYKLFGSVKKTLEWAGTGKSAFKPFYRRLVTKEQARQYWLLLPSRLAGTPVQLPPGHQLDCPLNPEVEATIARAQESLEADQERAAEAKARKAAERPAQLKAKQAEYNRRARLKAKERKKQAGGD